MKTKITKLFLGLVLSSSWALLLSINSVSAQSCTPTAKPYSLVNFIGATSTPLSNDNKMTITKTSEYNANWKTSGGFTSLTLKKGEYLEFKAAYGSNVIVGLLAPIGNIDPLDTFDYSHFTILSQYALYARTNNYALNVLKYVSGGLKQEIRGGYNDINAIHTLQIRYNDDNTISFFRNGNLMVDASSPHPVLEAPENGFKIVFGLHGKGDSIIDLQIFKCTTEDICNLGDDLVDVNLNGVPDACDNQPTIYCSDYNPSNDNNQGLPNTTGITFITPNIIEKNITHSAWGNAGVKNSNVELTEGSYITYKVLKGKNVVVGLIPISQNDTNYHYESINHGLYTRTDNFIYIIENGDSHSERKITTYNDIIVNAISNEFKILYQDGRVKYYYNNLLIYVSKKLYVPADKLRLDFSLHTAGSQIIDLKVCNAVVCATPVSIVKSNEDDNKLPTQHQDNYITYNTTNATAVDFSNLPTGLRGQFNISTQKIILTNDVSPITFLSLPIGSYNITMNITGACDSITTNLPIIINTKLRPDEYCGKTLTSFPNSSLIEASPDRIATQYEFEISGPPSSSFGTQTRISNTNGVDSFIISLNTFNGIQYNTTYSVRVRAFTNGNWSDFGDTCTITTPNIPLSTCSIVPNGLNFTVKASSVFLAEEYRYIIIFGTNVYTVDRAPNIYEQFLKAENFGIPGGILPGTEYQIQIAIKYLGEWQQPNTAYCSVITPSNRLSDKSVNNSIFKIKVYPNPFATHFNLDIESASDAQVELKVYDIIGRKLEDRKATVSKLSVLEVGRNYPAGVYNVLVSQGDNVKSVRIIKR